MEQVDSIHLKLENANILLISDEALISTRNALLKAECDDTITQNISSGGVVCQTRSVLEADVVYEIKYHNKISMEERAKLTSEIAAKLDLDAHQGADDKVSGSQLFFGIRLSPNPIVLKKPRRARSSPVRGSRIDAAVHPFGGASGCTITRNGGSASQRSACALSAG
ncbi:hypothetical protein [Bradyrhizobium sacchari]|uniref:Uncharacterized protein n=1 Tax=Bradyrhizobium sacchari TaxID=1399419 RepID=A0A560IU10_9BRAD|nr:hypothetical protein [Bradyrhizobium sacchari]TWB62522.1 hypothetical protein FBZ94_103217 [Bradyrhizobium sacchari]TWB76548.1 hypothetical protein FBZ95_104733 [Bradyrhizobium sacchari]